MCLGILISYIFPRFGLIHDLPVCDMDGRQPKSQRMSFGWHRAEVLGAITSVLMIWVVTGILFYMAVLRVINQDFEIDATAMLATSGLGVLVNIIMGASLHQHGHSHGGGGGGHGHGGGEEGHAHAEKDTENINVKAAFIPVIGDFLQSLGTIKDFDKFNLTVISRCLHRCNCYLLQTHLGHH